MPNTKTMNRHRMNKHNRSIVPNDYKPNVVWNIPPTPYFRWKCVLDGVLATLLIIPCLPIIIALVLLVRLTSRGPGIYRQCRLGKQGRKFFIYKIRTMVHDAEVRTGPVWSQSQDARITFIGHAIRKFHLDEFPQLFNVLKGEMSLVGPRPERPEFAEVLAKHSPEYSNRMVVRPGITGLAQLNLPPDSDLNSVRRKLALDLQYVEHANLFLDVRLLICTALRVLKLPVLRVLRLQRKVVLPAVPSGKGDDAADKEIITPACITHQSFPHAAKSVPAGQDGRRSPYTSSELHRPRKPK
jgi:lipopolysaccharide/colanic/teichoic acid biosynthesis glycosyltransferase